MKRKLEVQREIGKKNILYFKDTMYKKIFKFICKITLILILSNLFDNKLYYIFSLIYVIYATYSIYLLNKNYAAIINDIKINHMIVETITIEINFKKIIYNIKKNRENNYLIKKILLFKTKLCS